MEGDTLVYVVSCLDRMSSAVSLSLCCRRTYEEFRGNHFRKSLAAMFFDGAPRDIYGEGWFVCVESCQSSTQMSCSHYLEACEEFLGRGSSTIFRCLRIGATLPSTDSGVLCHIAFRMIEGANVCDMKLLSTIILRTSYEENSRLVMKGIKRLHRENYPFVYPAGVVPLTWFFTMTDGDRIVTLLSGLKLSCGERKKLVTGLVDSPLMKHYVTDSQLTRIIGLLLLRKPVRSLFSNFGRTLATKFSCLIARHRPSLAIGYVNYLDCSVSRIDDVPLFVALEKTKGWNCHRAQLVMSRTRNPLLVKEILSGGYSLPPHTHHLTGAILEAMSPNQIAEYEIMSKRESFLLTSSVKARDTYAIVSRLKHSSHYFWTREGAGSVLDFIVQGNGYVRSKHIWYVAEILNITKVQLDPLAASEALVSLLTNDSLVCACGESFDAVARVVEYLAKQAAKDGKVIECLASHAHGEYLAKKLKGALGTHLMPT